MAYDESKDKVVKDFGTVALDEDTQTDVYEFKLMQYEKGDIKLSITKRFDTKEGVKTTSKIGRINAELIPEFMRKLEEINTYLNFPGKKS